MNLVELSCGGMMLYQAQVKADREYKPTIATTQAASFICDFSLSTVSMQS